ncbi:MAG: HNH endonuclease [Waterburya sp.]
MPVNPSLYPDNWKELAMRVKNSQNWRCECCGKKCYKPGERPENLTRSEWTANILQVHHRNHDVSQNQITNLQAVCAACHLDLHRGGQYSRVSEGQLSLW